MRMGLGLALWLVVSHVSGALAKDLPRTEPERRTSGCEWAGAGFAKIEGSSTCVKIGGEVRTEFSATTARSSVFGR